MVRIFMCCNSVAGLLLCCCKHYKTWVAYVRSGLYCEIFALFMILCSDSLRPENYFRVKWLRKPTLTSQEHFEFYFCLSSPIQCFVAANLKSVVFTSSYKELINRLIRTGTGKKIVLPHSMYQFDQALLTKKCLRMSQICIHLIVMLINPYLTNLLIRISRNSLLHVLMKSKYISYNLQRSKNEIKLIWQDVFLTNRSLLLAITTLFLSNGLWCCCPCGTLHNVMMKCILTTLKKTAK